MTNVMRTLISAIDREHAEREPGWAMKAAGRALADHAVCGAAGWSALDHRMGGGAAGRAHVMGRSQTLSGGDAAAANAASAHALDRDDLHWSSLTHPGGVIWPAVLGLGEELEASGAAAVRAAAIGYDVTARLATALGAGHRQFWHATTTAGAVGAAAAAALVGGGDIAVAAAAAGHAAAVAGGSIQTLLERSPSRIFYRAHAARTAVAAALAALHGLAATQEILEGPRGFLVAASADGGVPTLVASLSDGPAIQRLTLRPYAASGFAHTAIDAALRLAPASAGSVERVRIVASPACVALAGDPRPRDRAAAWWSVQHAVAVCLLSGDATALEAAVVDLGPDVGALLEVTELETSDDPAALSATVELSARDGGTRRAAVAVPSGHPDRPLSDLDLARKWRAMLPRLTERDLGALRSAAAGLERRPLAQTAAQVAAVLAPPEA